MAEVRPQRLAWCVMARVGSGAPSSYACQLSTCAAKIYLDFPRFPSIRRPTRASFRHFFRSQRRCCGITNRKLLVPLEATRIKPPIPVCAAALSRPSWERPTVATDASARVVFATGRLKRAAPGEVGGRRGGHLGVGRAGCSQRIRADRSSRSSPLRCVYGARRPPSTTRASRVDRGPRVRHAEKYPTGAPGRSGTLEGGRGERLRALWKEGPGSPAWVPNAIETLPGGPRWFNRRPGRA